MPISYLVENDASCPQTIQRVDKENGISRGIVTFKWRSKSPDLNQIEPIWSGVKDEIASYQFTHASMETIKQAKETLIWVLAVFLQALIDRSCAIFHEKLERCILHDGNNNLVG